MELYKEVYYDEWCPKCKHWELPENESPCNECLTYSHREDSHKPSFFKERRTDEAD